MGYDYFDDADFVSAQPPATVNAAPVPINSATAVEQSRAVAEIQAAMIVAKNYPRDEIAAQNRIMDACKRPSLAATAIYSYPKGGSQVEGPSIRLAESIARSWGNIDFGLKELSRQNGVSEIMAYAWDLETNARRSMSFQVRHWRDTKKGGYAIKEERDIYELTANQGQRRVRSCILGLIPGDIVEEALAQCNRTLAGQSGKPLKDRIKIMITQFSQLDVTEKMLFDRIGHKLDTITEIELRQLGKLWNSIKDGYATAEEVFAPSPVKQQAAADKPSSESASPAQPTPAPTAAETPDDTWNGVDPPTLPKPRRKPIDEIDAISGDCWDICKQRNLPMDEMLAEMFPGTKKEKLSLEQWQQFQSSLV